MKRLLLALAVLLLLAGGAGVYGHYCWPRQSNGASKYRTMAVRRGDLVSIVTSTGTIQPVLSVQVGAVVSGPIQKVYVDFNAQVKAGELLAEVDQRTYKATILREEASLARQKADVERIKALLEQAARNEQRAKKLQGIKKTYISETEIDQYTTERKSLDAQVKLAEAAVRETEASLSVAKTNLEFTSIRSPVDGVVIDRKIDPGQSVASQFQTPTLFIVAPDLEKKIFVYASVDEADIGQIREAKERNEPVHFTVDAYPDDSFEGRINQVRLNPTTVQNVVTYTVIVESPNQKLKLLPGMTASLTFQIASRSKALMVPNAAVRFRPQAEEIGPDQPPAAAEPVRDGRSHRRVWLLEEGTLVPRDVIVGLSDKSYTEIVSGNLAEDQEVVVGLVGAEQKKADAGPPGPPPS